VDGKRSVAGKLKENGQRLLTTHTHTPLCGYGFSTGPTNGLTSWWPIDWSSPDSQQQKQITPSNKQTRQRMQNYHHRYSRLLLNQPTSRGHRGTQMQQVLQTNCSKKLQAQCSQSLLPPIFISGKWCSQWETLFGKRQDWEGERNG